MGDNPKKPEEGDDLLSKLFDEPDGGTEVIGSSPMEEEFGGSTRVDAPEDNTESIRKQSLGSAFEVSTSELNKNKPESDPSKTDFLSQIDNPFSAASIKTNAKGDGDHDSTEFGQSENLFDNVLDGEPIPDEKISFFEKAQPFGDGPREKTIILGEESSAEAGVSEIDPIEAALQQFQGQSQSSGASEDPLTLEAPSEISASDFEPRQADQLSEEIFHPKSEVKAEDFAEVFSNAPIPVSEVQAKRSGSFGQLKKVAVLLVTSGATLAVAGYGFQKFRSDEGLLGYRLNGLSVERAYQPPTPEELQVFAEIFKESENTLLADSPLETAAVFTKLKSVLEKDERNVEALSRMLDHSAVLIGWYGTASPWSQRFEEGLDLINKVSQKSKAFVDSLIIERAKSHRAITLGDYQAAADQMGAALGRFNVGDDLSFIVLAEANLKLGNKKSAESWMGRVTNKSSKRARFVNALIHEDAKEFQALSAEGYLPGRVLAFTSQKMSTQLADLKARLVEADALMLELKDFPVLALSMKTYNGDLHQAAGEGEKARGLWKEVLAQYPKDLSVWMKVAASFEQDALWDEALNAYQGMERAGGLSESSMERYAELLRVRGRHLDAAGLVARGLERFPKSARLFYTQGKILLDLYQIDPAKEAFGKSLAADPKFELATLGLVDIAMQRREYNEAAKLLKTIGPESSHRGMALASLGRLELIKGNLKEAEGFFTDSIRLDPKQESVYAQVVDIQLRQERDGEALSFLEDAEKIFPRSAEITMAKARILQFQRRYDDALAAIDGIRKTHDHLVPLQLLSADLMMDTKDYAGAAAILAKLQAKESRDPDLFYLRAKLFYKDQGASTKDITSAEMAIKVLEGAVRQKPDVDRYRVLMGRLALRVQDKIIAQEQADSILRVNAKSSEGYALLGEIQMDSGNYEAAAKSFKTALNLTRNRSPLYTKLAESFKQLGQTGQAIEYYKKVTQEHPKDADAHLELGKLYNQEGRFQGAVASFKRAISLNARLSEAFYFLGFIQKEMGDRDGALKSFETFLSLVPSGSESATIRDEVYFLKNGRSPN